MTSSDAWREVGAKLEAIGLKLKLHYQQEHRDEPEEDEPEERDTFNRLADAIDDAFDALGNAAADDAVKADVRDAGQALSNALAATFSDVSRSMKKALKPTDDAEPVLDESDDVRDV